MSIWCFHFLSKNSFFGRNVGLKNHFEFVWPLEEPNFPVKYSNLVSFRLLIKYHVPIIHWMQAEQYNVTVRHYTAKCTKYIYLSSLAKKWCFSFLAGPPPLIKKSSNPKSAILGLSSIKKHDTITHISFGSFPKKCSKLLV